MSRIQRFIYWLLPAWLAKDMEKESRKWMLRCNTCGHETSIWDIGGIRYKAYGRPYTYYYCRGCHHCRWMQICYRNEPRSP